MRRPSASAWRSVLAAVAVGLALAAPAVAEDEPVAWGYSLANELMSPFCPGRTLSQCPSPQAAELRQWVILQAAAGASRAEVEAILLERYGEGILQKPKAEGWGFFAYLIPVVFFLAGGPLVWWLLRRLVDARPDRPAPVAPVARVRDSELERLVDEELERA